MLDQRLPRVLGASRHVPARARQQGSQHQLIPTHNGRRDPPRAHARDPGRPSASARRRMSSIKSGKGRVAALGRATSTISMSGAICSRTRRYASRIRRRARLRRAAPRSWRLTAKPTRRLSARRQRTTKLPRSCRLPRWKTVWKSAARRRRSPRGSANAAGAFATVAALDGEALATLCAPPLQDLSPALRLHPRAKSVRLLAPAHIGLERPLHQRSSPLGRRTHVVYGPPLPKSRYVRALRPHSTV
jgi:hypothetical protein